MRVLLLGATGRPGRAVLDLALERGHTVTALVISPEKLITRSAQLVVMAGDACDQESVTAAVRGCDGVICRSVRLDVWARSSRLLHRDIERLITAGHAAEPRDNSRRAVHEG